MFTKDSNGDKYKGRNGKAESLKSFESETTDITSVEFVQELSGTISVWWAADVHGYWVGTRHEIEKLRQN